MLAHESVGLWETGGGGGGGEKKELSGRPLTVLNPNPNPNPNPGTSETEFIFVAQQAD